MCLSSKAGCSGTANNTSPVIAMRDNRGATPWRVARQRPGRARYYLPSSPAAMKRSGIAVGCSVLLVASQFVINEIWHES